MPNRILTIAEFNEEFDRMVERAKDDDEASPQVMPVVPLEELKEMYPAREALTPRTAAAYRDWYLGNLDWTAFACRLEMDVIERDVLIRKWEEKFSVLREAFISSVEESGRGRWDAERYVDERVESSHARNSSEAT